MTDNYEFLRSTLPQGADKYSPYVRKDWNNVNDINNGVYTNTSMSLVQFDLSSIYNSSKYVDTNELFITLPIQISAAVTVAAAPGAIVDPSTIMPAALVSLKSGYHNLIHSADLVINGKTVEQTQPYLNKFVDFKLLSEMSKTDLEALGPSLGYSSEVDNPFSIRWNAAAASNGGNGLCNNYPFSNATNLAPHSSFKYATPSTGATAQNLNNVANIALAQRIMSVADTTVAAAQTRQNNLYGAAGIMTLQQLSNELKTTYNIDNNIKIINKSKEILKKDY